jgi:hypothetical protein
MSILDYFVPVKDDPDRLCCTLCHENLKIDSWYSNLKKHFKRVHNQEFAEFELMVKAEKEKAAAVEKAEGDDILLKSQAEFSKFNEDVSLDDIKPTFSISGPSSSSVFLGYICPRCNGKFMDLKVHLPTCQQKTVL